MNKAYYQKNKERIREQQREYRKKHPEKLREYNKRWRDKNPEKAKQYSKNYYDNNYDHIKEVQKVYFVNNREKITKLILNRRKQKAEELKAKGQIWTYLPKTARENKMSESLAKKFKCSVSDAKQLLIENDWNYKMIVESINEGK